MGISISDLSPKAREQALVKLAILEGKKRAAKPDEPKPRKYRNRKDSRGALRFDSQKEAARYDALMLMLRAGDIRNLKLQPQFTLQESFLTPDGERVRAVRYVADFSFEKPVKSTTRDGETVTQWETVVEDVKSPATKTQKYAIKKKLLLERFGIEIMEV